MQLYRSWWNSNTINQLEIGDYLPFAVGDFSLPSYAFTTALIFSKDMVESLSLEDPYEAVMTGKWTLDYFCEYIRNASSDLDGDGIFGDGDRYGFASNITYHPQAFPTSCDIGFITKDPQTGYPNLSLNIEKFMVLLEKLHSIFNVEKVTYRIPHDELCPINFDENRVLITLVWLSHLENYRSSDSDYGIIPLPKFDENQENYYTLINRRGCVFAIPIDTIDIDRTGLLLEALSILSHEEVIPVYFDSILNAKYTRDEKSIEMLNIIMNGARYDFGYYYPTAYTGSAITSMLGQGNTNAASYFASNNSAAELYYKDLYEMYQSNSTSD